MSKLKNLVALLSACFIVAGLAVPRCEAAGERRSDTRIISVQSSVKGNSTRLIFDAEGERPKQIGPPSDQGISIFFQQIESKLPDKVFKEKNNAAKEIKFRREGGFLEVLFRMQNTSVSSSVRPGKKGRYAIVLELTQPRESAESQRPAPTDANPEAAAGSKAHRPEVLQIEVNKVDSLELFGGKASQPLDEKAKEAVSPRSAVTGPNKPAFVEPDEKALALYSNADEKFEDCSRNLNDCASEIFDAYEEAVAAAPQAPQAPVAFYRLGVVQSLMGNYSKADKLFRHVIEEWADHPVACRCLIGIGGILNKKQAFIEAMETFREAARSAVEKDDKAAADYELGKLYQMLGANKEAIRMLENCNVLALGYYLKRPDILRIMGDAYFALGNFDKAKEHLLKFVNCQQSAADLHLVLAKIAEIYLIKGDIGAAKKMYAFVGKYYRDSEGDLICRIRSAELLDKAKMQEAIDVYKDILGKDLSPSLRRIVLIKLAALSLNKGDLAQCLELMDDAFPVKKDGSSPPGTSDLRVKLLGSLVDKLFSNKDFMQVVQLHDKYRKAFDSMQESEIPGEIAESYASLKFYSNALEIYDSLLAKAGLKGETLLKCAVYALRINENDRAFKFCKLVQSETLDLKKSEVLGHIFYRDHKYTEAVKYFSKILEKGKDLELNDPDSLASYGYCLYQTKKFEEAVPILQKTLRSERVVDAYSQRSILVTLSRCFAELKQFQKATEAMENAIHASGDNQKNELMYDISKLYVAAGQSDKALQNLNQIKATEDPFWGPAAQQQINTIEMGNR